MCNLWSFIENIHIHHFCNVKSPGFFWSIDLILELLKNTTTIATCMENVNTSLHSKEESKNRDQWWKTQQLGHCKFGRSLNETGDVKKEKGFGDHDLFFTRIGGQLLLLWKVVFLNDYWIVDQMWIISVKSVVEKMMLIFGMAQAFSSFTGVLTMDAISGEA